MWGDICSISKDVPAFKDFGRKFAADPEKFRDFFYHSEPYEHFDMLPDFVTSMTPFQQVLALRVIRLDKLVPTISQFVANDRCT